MDVSISPSHCSLSQEHYLSAALSDGREALFGLLESGPDGLGEENCEARKRLPGYNRATKERFVGLTIDQAPVVYIHIFKH